MADTGPRTNYFEYLNFGAMNNFTDWLPDSMTIEVANYLQQNEFLALPDTGAINGMAGLRQMVNYDARVLKPLGLGFQKLPPPAECGGIGGRAEVICALVVPIALGGHGGLLAVIVTKQDLPWLLPVGLMRALKAEISLGNGREVEWDTITWRKHQGNYANEPSSSTSTPSISEIRYLPTGHPAIDITNGLETFKEQNTELVTYHRTPQHDEVMGRLASLLTGGPSSNDASQPARKLLPFEIPYSAVNSPINYQ